MYGHKFNNNYLLFDSIIFIHVSHNKNRFTNFRKATKD